VPAITMPTVNAGDHPLYRRLHKLGHEKLVLVSRPPDEFHASLDYRRTMRPASRAVPLRWLKNTGPTTRGLNGEEISAPLGMQ
jgi:hypothetical protein